MLQLWHQNYKKVFILLASLICSLILAGQAFSDVVVNILAVNGTDKSKEKEISYLLPTEINAEDVLDTAGLQLNYDVGNGAYAVVGKVSLGPKETKTLKVRMRDIWTIDQKEIDNIKTQIDESLDRVKNTEYHEIGLVRKDYLLKRLNFIAEQQEKYADNVEKRIDAFRIYGKELNEIRHDAVSVDYWRTKPPKYDKENIITFVVEATNQEKTERTYEHKHYLPPEVKPEHVVDSQGFDIRYDGLKGQSYLVKEDTFKPGETKKYQISIVDVWNIPQQKIDNLKDRARDVYKLLEKTQYEDSARYLVSNIKDRLEKIETSQAQEKNINEHISTYTQNKKEFDLATDDVESLENLLRAVRETLERSKLKNVLEKLKSFKGIAELIRSIFKKPEVNTAWKIIIGIVIFVGLFTIIHFAIWGNRSKNVKIEEENEEESKEKS